MRLLPIDILRLLACLMVVLMHSPIPGSAATIHAPFLTTLSYITTPCVPLFFMVSGALLLNNKVKDLPTIEWLKRRLSKVVIPTILFSLFYICLYVPSEKWGASIASIPFSAQGHGVLWFMYTLVGLYLITPIIKPWLNNASEKEVRIYLILWGVTLLFPYLGKYIGVNETNTGILYYLTGYSGYFLLGHYLSRWSLGTKCYWCLLTLTGLVLPLPLLNKILEWNLDFYSAFWYLSAPVCIMTMAWFCSISRLFTANEKTNPLIVTASNLCFGIYLVHIFVMRDVLWNLDIINGIANYYLQTGVVFILTLLISLGICWLIALLPFGQYIVGYKHKS